MPNGKRALHQRIHWRATMILPTQNHRIQEPE
ncbi:hypothetical protein [Caudoviricetes sp.]|nr:hypothetical protein [Caudoviricetes sp.]UOF81111.1 hypothetical protein [Caudoviricetes sp.]UOF82253.1 hypothetical protein [Caudoviricetes sp.]UOF82456.1 hypothetical protein [Caudoviricetes sp.]UOF82610.1 hypothetical protein [Caudoviricetes sp.]